MSETLETALFLLFEPIYTGSVARKLAKAHVQAHEQFLHALYLKKGGHRPKGKGREIAKSIKPIKLPEVRARHVRGAPTRVRTKSPMVPIETIQAEIVSILRSTGRTVTMAEVIEACAPFSWTHAQVKRAMRAAKKKGLVEQIGDKKITRYTLPLANHRVGAKLNTGSLSAQQPSD